MERVVITGYGIDFIGKSVSSQNSFESIFHEFSNHSKLISKNSLDQELSYYQSDIIGSDYFDRRDLLTLDRYAQLAIIAADRAITNSCINTNSLGEHAAVYWGTGMGSVETISYVFGEPEASRKLLLIPTSMPHSAAANIGIKYGILGEAKTLASACSASMDAIYDAFQSIALGYTKVCIAGGSESQISPTAIKAWQKLGVLSRRNITGKFENIPFSSERNGFILGEGGGAVIMESYEHAKRRGANILAEVLAVSKSNDGYNLVTPSTSGQFKCMKKCIVNSGLDISDIDLIVTHGTATKVGDKVEIESLTNIFGGLSKIPLLTANKHLLGHTIGASGVFNVIQGLSALSNSENINKFNLLLLDAKLEFPELKLLTENTKKIRKVLCNSFAFGGSNTSIILAGV